MDALEILLIGFGIGIGAGISPGPLLTLVISTTLERGFAAGVRVASAPLWTDLPIIVAGLWLLSRLPGTFLAGLSLVGGAVVIFVGCETAWRAWHPPPQKAEEQPASRDFLRGMLVNFLSPHPWIAWLTILGPQILSLHGEHGTGFVAIFLFLFYGGLIGSKVAIAWGVARSRRLLTGRGYRIVLVLCAVLLIVLGGILAVQGLADLLGDKLVPEFFSAFG